MINCREVERGGLNDLCNDWIQCLVTRRVVRRLEKRIAAVVSGSDMLRSQ